MTRIKLFLLFLFFGLIIACESTKDKADKENVVSGEDTIEVVDKNDKIERAIVHSNKYLNICDEPFTWIGGIQGLKPTDSTKVFPMGECTGGKTTYRLIWMPNVPFKERKKWSAQEVSTLFENEQDRNKNFTCYKFVMPLHNREKVGPDGETAIFPCEVEVYQQTNSGWKNLGSYGVESNAQFARVQLKAIYGYLEERKAG